MVADVVRVAVSNEPVTARSKWSERRMTRHAGRGTLRRRRSAPPPELPRRGTGSLGTNPELVTRRVALRDERRGRHTRYLDAYVDAKGALDITGQDLGPATSVVSAACEYERAPAIPAFERVTRESSIKSSVWSSS